MTHLERRQIFGLEWRELDETHVHAYLGLLILAGVYKSKDESTAYCALLVLIPNNRKYVKMLKKV